MPLTLTVLGTASPHPRPGRPASGCPLRGGGAEKGRTRGSVRSPSCSGTRIPPPPARLTAIWIPHLHADHSADLVAAMYGFAYGGLTLPVPLPRPRAR